MPDCLLLDACLFFNDSSYVMAEIDKEKYCKGDFAWCGRYMVFKALEGELKRREYIQVQDRNQGY